MTGKRTPAGPHPAARRPVYVIDDDPSMERSLGRLLTVSEWQVQSFASAEAFLEDLDKLSRGFLVVDVQLPGISGLELLERLRESSQAWPAVVMSGSDDESIEREALRLGARTFLHKPFAPQALLDALEEMAASSTVDPKRCWGR
jgi:FixJ family two-component response regulator